MKVLLHDEARLEMREAADHYDLGREGRGDVFVDAVVARAEDVARMPGIAHREPDAPADIDVRRVLLRRHPYALILVVESAESMLLIAVAHEKREPGYWHHRIGR